MLEYKLYKLLGSSTHCIRALVVVFGSVIVIMVVKLENPSEHCINSDLNRIYLGSELNVGKLYNFDGHIL